MADTTLRLRYPTGQVVQLQIGSGAGLTVWNGTALVTPVAANWNTYLLAFPETPAGFGQRVFDFAAFAAAHPSVIVAQDYWWAAYPTGSSAGQSDVGHGSGTWDGTTFSTGGTVTLPVPAPLTYGPVGTGSVAVNQDYPTTGNLAFKTAGGQGIGGAQVRAYLASEYAANPNTATVRGQTITLNDGSWANNIDLNVGAAIVTFDAPGYATTVVTLTVS